MSEQQLRVGDVLDTSFRVFRENLKLMLAITSMAAVVHALLAVPAQWPVLIGRVLSPIEQANLDDPLLAVIAAIVLTAVTRGAVIWAAFNGLRGQRQTAIQCWMKSLRLIAPLVCTSVAIAFLALFGFICCIIPGVIAISKYALAAPAVVLEGRNTGGSINRSGRLVEGNSGKVLLTVLIAGIIVSILAVALEAVLATVLGLEPLALYLPRAKETVSIATAILSIGDAFISVLLLPLSTIPSVVLFMTLRDLKEGTELEYEVGRLVDTTASQDAQPKQSSF